MSHQPETDQVWSREALIRCRALTVNNLSHPKVGNSGDCSNGLVLCQVEGIHQEAAGVDPGVVEGRVQV